MSGMLRSSLKLYPSYSFMNAFKPTIASGNAKQRLYSTLWNTSVKSTENNVVKSAAVWNTCSISSKQYATRKVEADLAEFLEQEIAHEQKTQKHETIPSKIDDFEVKLDGSEVTLEKSLPNETITISFSINESLTEPDPIFSDSEDMNENSFKNVESKPEFIVDIKKGDTTLSFSCSFNKDSSDLYSGGEDLAGDVFQIDKISLYKGEWNETNYEISGEIIDGQLYELLMTFLEEKGISNEFVDKLSELSTAYEHSSYVSLLRELKNFTSK